MMSPKIADVYSIHQRFLRSINLERDFRDDRALDNYIVTPQIKRNISRIFSGLQPTSSQRAWRITGDYGSGKSAFALAVARMLSRRPQHLPANLVELARTGRQGNPAVLLPVLITGTRESMSHALLRALQSALAGLKPPREFARLKDRIRRLTESSHLGQFSDTEVIQLVEDLNDYLVTRKHCSGIVIILDELGKFLEYSALRPEQQDIYFLQSLAELAARSAEKPILLLSLLHQGFSAYADQLSLVTQREWNKVADRFEEILFNHPLDQISTVVAEALTVKVRQLPPKLIEQTEMDMSAIVELGWYGSAEGRKSLILNAARLYPLHPTVLPVLVWLFSRFGQNERSLFSFLLSDEPFALKDFSQRTLDMNNFYRLHNLYDYARSTFGNRLGLQNYRSRWSLIESVLDTYSTDNTTELNILKTVAMLNLLDGSHLLASEKVIQLSIEGESRRKSNRTLIKETLAQLHKTKHVLHYRGASGEYCLWSNTSVNLERAYDEAAKAIPSINRISSDVVEELEVRPLVARRHYIETGNLRHFDVKYVPMVECQSAAAAEMDWTVADGRIVIPLCETPEERNCALEFARSTAVRNRPEILVGVPQPLAFLSGALLEVRRWEWISNNVADLSYDAYAAEEVSRQVLAARQALQRRLNMAISLQHFDSEIGLQWFRLGRPAKVYSSHTLLQYLSTICDEVFSQAPRVFNELVNRRALSSAAAAARMRLIEAIFQHSAKPNLGMPADKKPPEMSMYLSVLRASNLHHEIEGSWCLTVPMGADPCRLGPIFHFIHKYLQERPEKRVKLIDLFSALRMPPYGVRDGLHLLLLSVYLLINEHETAVYENDIFVKSVSGEDFQRIAKAPTTFELQHYRIEGVRTVLFEKMREILGLGSPLARKSDILDVVRPLLTFIGRLPPFSQKTQKLPASALQVRRVLLTAREPVTMLFSELPRACGFDAFDHSASVDEARVSDFVTNLKDALDSLKSAYPELMQQMRTALLRIFELPEPFPVAREQIALKSDRALTAVRETQLRAFCLRLNDRSLPEQEWLESVGSLVCSKPPSKWLDGDAVLFVEELGRLGDRLQKVESIAFASSDTPSAQAAGMRIALTSADGRELDRVLQVSAQEEDRVTQLEQALLAVVESSGRLGLAAITRVVWQMLGHSHASGSGSLHSE